jgi:hypothetical protein
VVLAWMRSLSILKGFAFMFNNKSSVSPFTHDVTKGNHFIGEMRLQKTRQKHPLFQAAVAAVQLGASFD